jgi:hypothetical protein
MYLLRFACILLLIAVPVSAFSEAPPVIEVDQAVSQALMHGDRAALGHLLADGYVGTTAGGVREDRAALLASGPGAAISGYEVRDVQTQSYPAAAVITSTITRQAGDAKESYQSTRLYVKINGQWLLAARHESPLAK